ISNGVDPLPDTDDEKVAVFRAENNLNPDDMVVTFFGRMAKEKNVDILIPMFEQVKQKVPSAKLLLSGDNEYRATLMKKAQLSWAADSIVFSGRYKRADLQTICAVSDVYVYPALSDTQAIVLNEAALGSLPLVLVDQEVNDVASFGVNALFATNTPDDLAEKVVKLLQNDDMRASFAAESLRIACEFTIRNQAEKVINLYNQVKSDHIRQVDG
ncbi:MAG: glycosyltransferase, partial [Coriobacteriia bacterium]|nr:glycosyltransferase [Coriobacteriia bacterium]